MEASAAYRYALGALRWLQRRQPKTRGGRIAVYSAAFVVLTVPSVALLAATVLTDRQAAEDWFGALGYAGVFLANLLSTGTVFIPVPGLLAVSQALIVSEADVLSPLAVGLVGGLGMGLGETTAYLTGLAGSHVARETEVRGPRWIQPAIDRVIKWVSWLMTRYGLVTLFVLAVIPDPIFEFAGITAGATRVSFRRYMAVVVTGNCVRGLLLAYVGRELL